jgi:hypothetical protein
MIIKEQVQAMLEGNICLVEFAKTNGEMRSMACTLRGDMIPKVKGTGRAAPAENMTVWCVDKMGWRSFKMSNVKSVRVLPQRI